ncbi:MAG: hypothetical protein EU542_02900 [Promethearchaeota archaeon]|nr:MAG: hypothetical protein EU542_02900 [Candidatus Lokiarchaeota archaeon]
MGKKNKIFQWNSEANEEAINFTQPDIMLKLVSTIDERGWPHITMISSNRIISNKKLVWGAFTEGLSKKYVKENPKQGIFYMTAEMPFKFVQVKAHFSHTSKEGSDLEHFNKSQLMRYFTYVRTHTAYYNDIISATSVRDLPLLGIIKGLLKTLIGRDGAKTKLPEKRLNVVGYKLFRDMIAVRVISYIDPNDGYPVMIPVIQLQAADHNRLVFPPSVLKDNLLNIPINAKVAVFGMNFEFVNQVVKGTFVGYKRYRGVKLGVIDIEEIYNSCPPVTGIIYPELETRPKVEEFTL